MIKIIGDLLLWQTEKIQTHQWDCCIVIIKYDLFQVLQDNGLSQKYLCEF